jgi:hypothetical protein
LLVNRLLLLLRASTAEEPCVIIVMSALIAFSPDGTRTSVILVLGVPVVSLRRPVEAVPGPLLVIPVPRIRRWATVPGAVIIPRRTLLVPPVPIPCAIRGRGARGRGEWTEWVDPTAAWGLFLRVYVKPVHERHSLTNRKSKE